MDPRGRPFEGSVARLGGSRRAIAQRAEYQAQHPHGALLVERIVAVATLGRLHTRWATERAFARLYRRGGRRPPRVQLSEAAIGEARPAGVPVVDEDRRQPLYGAHRDRKSTRL